jgi:hypothetical protein
MGPPANTEGLKTARLLMVLSSVWPLFILVAIRGIPFIRDSYVISACLVLLLLPTAALAFRIFTARRNRERRYLTIGKAEDHRDHLLVYLFAMLLPLYAVDFSNLRNAVAAGAALAFIVFLFWHLNLHYMNLLFAVCGYRVFTVFSPEDGNPLTSRDAFVLITKRASIPADAQIDALRLSDTVYLEDEP